MGADSTELQLKDITLKDRLIYLNNPNEEELIVKAPPIKFSSMEIALVKD